MKKHLLFFTLMCVIFVSCQKEISTELPDEPELPGDTTAPITGKLLERTVTIDAPDDSLVTRFFYNAEGKVIKITEQSLGASRENASYYDIELQFYRNGKEKVERLLEIWFIYEGFDLIRKDSSFYEVFHNPANGHYMHAIHYDALVWFNPTEITRDSIAYAYNSKGQMDLVQIFRKDEITGNYFEAQRNEYTYNSIGNVTKVRGNENYDNTGDPLTEVLIPEFDDKINPQNFGDESLLTGLTWYGIPGPNNPTKEIYDSGVSEYVYTYNQFDLPETVIYKQGTTVWNLTKFYYR